MTSQKPFSKNIHKIDDHFSLSRREFLKFLGLSSAAFALATTGCTSMVKKKKDHGPLGLAPQQRDELVLLSGLSYKILASFGDAINEKETFGYNNDYIALLPGPTSDRLVMWVNHEYFDPWSINPHTFKSRDNSTLLQEKKAVGGSLLLLTERNGDWLIEKNSKMNKRWDALTPIPFSNGVQILNRSQAQGTFANCAGGVTSWGTFLSCEENYQDFVGDVSFSENKRTFTPSRFIQWDSAEMPPEHYGWVVEIDPKAQTSQKLISLGRFSHECATVTHAKDGRAVVYMGDDKAGECFYKFISQSSSSLTEGILYVADLTTKQWQPIQISEPKLRMFKSQTELLIRTREAAKLMGGTPLNRPEDVAVHPLTQDVFVACTNNKKVGDAHGAIYKFSEKQADAGALSFDWSIYRSGGEKSGFSSPDNLMFDSIGNLWITTDVDEKLIQNPDYQFLGNNSLFLIPAIGPHRGELIRVASGPNGCELTGPCLSPDESTLFLSVQHPGGDYKVHKGRPLSAWPFTDKEKPLPSVVAIKGPLLKNLIEKGEWSFDSLTS